MRGLQLAQSFLEFGRDQCADVPDTPRRKQKGNPRPFFRFHPLVPRERDAFQALLSAAKEMAEEEVDTALFSSPIFGSVFGIPAGANV